MATHDTLTSIRRADYRAIVCYEHSRTSNTSRGVSSPMRGLAAVMGSWWSVTRLFTTAGQWMAALETGWSLCAAAGDLQPFPGYELASNVRYRNCNGPSTILADAKR